MFNLMKIYFGFSFFSDLKRNKKECEIPRIGVLKGAKVTLGGMKCVNLKERTNKDFRN